MTTLPPSVAPQALKPQVSPSGWRTLLLVLAIALLALMGAVNDLRLVLGTRLDVSEETDLAVDPTNPDAGAYALYGYLGFLLETCVDAISS